MKRLFLNISLILSSGLVLLYGCKKDDEPGSGSNSNPEPERIYINGLVIDQVSKQPVTEAAIYLAGLQFDEPGLEFTGISVQTATNKDGRYSFSVLKSDYSVEKIRNSTIYPYIYAQKNGYAGSSYHRLMFGYNDTIELYHPSRLILNIWNDTLKNNIDNISFYLSSTTFSSYPGYIGRVVMGTPVIKKNCTGRKFNEVFEFSPLWSNVTYTLSFFPEYIYPLRKITIKPDSAQNFSISF